MMVLALVALVSLPAARAQPPATSKPATQAVRHYVLHLPGVGGYLTIDRNLKRGLAAGGVRGTIEHYDWTHGAPGLNALKNEANKQAQVASVAAWLLERLREHPGQPITLTAHSGGAAIAVWALEKLPPEAQIERLILLAPALSPEYDLSAALAHVRTRAYVFSSIHDPVLGPGTRAFGTMDGVFADAAGRVGFSPPAGADPAQYAKLVPMAYRDEWVELGNGGDHIGAMSPAFVRAIIAPLITGDSP
jgi:pimeloyl-ACP methyl ester carboxylesterase